MKFLAYLVCYCIYPFSFLFPRNKKKWAFGSFRGAFDGNAKYLLIYASKQCPDIDAAWLSINKSTVEEVRGKGLKAYYVLSPKGILFALTSKFWLFNAYSSDIMFCLSGNATLVNLWHGIPMKHIEFDIDSGPLANRYVKKTLKERFYHPEAFKRPDYLLSSSRMFSEMFARAFRITIDQCLEYGCPRNEILVWPDDKRMEFVERCEPETTLNLIATLKERDFSHVYVYLPTWRDGQDTFLSSDFDLRAMDEVLRSKNAALILKPHANTAVDVSTADLTHIFMLPASLDIYPILPYTDVLITDYSSVLYDYILMEGKSVILYLYDYQSYVKDRSFIWPYDDMVVGQKAFDFQTLLNLIREENFGLDEAERKQLLQKCWGDNLGDAGKRISLFLQQS